MVQAAAEALSEHKDDVANALHAAEAATKNNILSTCLRIWNISMNSVNFALLTRLQMQSRGPPMPVRASSTLTLRTFSRLSRHQITVDINFV